MARVQYGTAQYSTEQRLLLYVETTDHRPHITAHHRPEIAVLYHATNRPMAGRTTTQSACSQFCTDNHCYVHSRRRRRRYARPLLKITPSTPSYNCTEHSTVRQSHWTVQGPLVPQLSGSLLDFVQYVISLCSCNFIFLLFGKVAANRLLHLHSRIAQRAL